MLTTIASFQHHKIIVQHSTPLSLKMRCETFSWSGFLLLVAVLLWNREAVAAQDPGSISKFSAETDPKVLNIHIVPHTHDDVGWLKTVEQYYYGLNGTIQKAAVAEILSSVVESLLANPSRTFTYVEQKFFTMWWNEQSDAVRDSVRFLVANGQLNFVNGGWCMHDEASTHFISMIDQTTLGHTFLNNELGVIPKIGWQLDPFGHSATQASLLTSKVGFDALYFGRIDYQDLQLRRLTQECEGLWNSSTAWRDSTVFWGLTGSFEGNYGAPKGFCFDVKCDHPGEETGLTLKDQTQLNNSIHQFLREVRVQSNIAKGNHVMLTMGSDFQVSRGKLLCLRSFPCFCHLRVPIDA